TAEGAWQAADRFPNGAEERVLWLDPEPPRVPRDADVGEGVVLRLHLVKGFPAPEATEWPVAIVSLSRDGRSAGPPGQCRRERHAPERPAQVRVAPHPRAAFARQVASPRPELDGAARKPILRRWSMVVLLWYGDGEGHVHDGPRNRRP